MKPLLPVALALLVAGCALSPPPRPGLLDVVERPAEQALLAGLRAYEDAQYVDAEKQFSLALKLGLASPKDRAAADKHLAFIYCTSNRVTDCEAAFRAARQADPGFALSKSEAGHPLWGPVYRRVQP
ncbi:MAG: TssQ family T6SS-associated lipoprotein [Pseudomonadota bacterium]|jgi:Tfp pilus assembly protein PilF|nr:TssQ family T6SS-associated lipoprotein [Pseudomonadota bacterium]